MPQRKRAVGGRAPVRLVARLISEFILGAATDSRRTFDGNLTQALLLTTIAHANVAHLTYDPHAASLFPPDGSPADADRRPVSIQAVAIAMRMPYATAHRQINLLIEQGFCVRVERRGVMVPLRVLQMPQVQADQNGIHMKFLEMVAAMRKLGLILPVAVEPAGDPNTQAVRRIEVDFLLSILEISLLPTDWDIVQLTLFATLIALNVREITYDPGLSWLYAYADTPPPLSQYRPVSVRRLSETVDIPYETARQCVNRLLERGQVDRVPGGLIVKYDWNNSAEQYQMRQAFLGRFVRAMTALARLGVDFSEDVVSPTADQAAVPAAGRLSLVLNAVCSSNTFEAAAKT